MKFNFGQIQIKKFVFIKEKCTFLIVDKNGRFFTFYYPSVEEINELSNNGIDLILSEIIDINMLVKEIGHLFFLANFIFGESTF
jgi:hypothetical protein